MVEQVAYEDARKARVRKRKLCRVCGGEAGVRQLAAGEPELACEAIDPDASNIACQSLQVVALAAAQLEAGRGEQGEKRSQQLVLGFGDAGRAGRPAVLRLVGVQKVRSLAFAESGFGAVHEAQPCLANTSIATTCMGMARS